MMEAKISKAWPGWKDKLVAVPEQLEEDQYLIIVTKHGNHYVQFAGQGAFGIRMETTSNEYLEKTEKLSEEQIRLLLEAGWSNPTGDALSATPTQDPDGSPNYFADFAPPIPYEVVADLTVRTFFEILRVPHPGWLKYEAFDGDSNSLTFPHLGLKCGNEEATAEERETLPIRLLNTLRTVTGLDDLDFDRDGDIGLRIGNTAIFARLIEGLKMVRYFSVLLHEVDPSPRLYERLNEFNSNSANVRFFYRNRAVFAVSDTCLLPFSDETIAFTFHYYAAIAEGMDSILRSEFGGETSTEEPAGKVVKH